VEILFCGFFCHKKDCNAKPAACGTPKYLNSEMLLILELSRKNQFLFLRIVIFFEKISPSFCEFILKLSLSLRHNFNSYGKNIQ
jgi:hypothetical protein